MLDELTLQRCVDGELSESEHREFLKTVEQTPGGWRMLALAFSEEQIWCATVSSTLSDPLPQPRIVTNPRQVTATNTRGRVSLVTLTLSLLVALASGLLVGDIWRESRTPIVANRSIDLPNSSGTNMVNVDQQPLPAPVQTTSVPSSEYVVDLMGADGQIHQVAYPVYDPPDLAPAYRPQLPENVEEELLRVGYQLRRRQQMKMIPQANGEQILFSIELLRAEPIQ